MEMMVVPQEWMEEIERKLDRIERNTMPKPKAPVLGKVLSAKAVAEMMGVSTQTIYRWAREGQIRCVRTGGRVLFPDSSIRELMERRDA